MSANKEVFEDYLEVRRLEEESLRLNKKRKQVFLSTLALAYVVVIIVALPFLYTEIFLDSGETEDRTFLIEREIATLNEEILRLKELVRVDNAQTPSFIYLNNKIDQLETSQQSLYNSLLLKPEEVVTVRLLTEKSEFLNAQFSSLKNDFREIKEELANLRLTVIVIPLFAILGFLIKITFFNKKEENLI